MHLFLLPLQTVNSLRIKTAFFCDRKALWGLVRTAWVFNTSSTNWCGSAAGLVINFSTQCGSGELCRVGSEQGEAPDLPGTQSLLHRKAHTLFSLRLTHPQCQWMKDSGAKQRCWVMSPFLLWLKYCLSLIQTSELMFWCSRCGSWTISLGHLEPQFSYF